MPTPPLLPHQAAFSRHSWMCAGRVHTSLETIHTGPYRLCRWKLSVNPESCTIFIGHLSSSGLVWGGHMCLVRHQAFTVQAKKRKLRWRSSKLNEVCLRFPRLTETPSWLFYGHFYQHAQGSDLSFTPFRAPQLSCRFALCAQPVCCGCGDIHRSTSILQSATDKLFTDLPRVSNSSTRSNDELARDEVKSFSPSVWHTLAIYLPGNQGHLPMSSLHLPEQVR